MIAMRYCSPCTAAALLTGRQCGNSRKHTANDIMMMGFAALGRAAFSSSATGHPNMHFRSKLTLVVFISSLSLMGCSGEEDSTQQKEDHVFKKQTQTIDKARDVARQLDETAGKQKEAAQ